MIDFLVIGGGIAGVSVGAHLSALGSVTVLEAEDALGYHASGRSAAMFEENYGAPAVRALTTASKAFFTRGQYLSPRGLLMVGTPSNRQAFDASATELGLHPVTLDEARSLMPILDTTRVDRAAIHVGASDIDTDLLQQDYVRTLRHNGANIVTRAHVTAITYTKGTWYVTGSNVMYQAKTIVNAAGAWVDQIAQLAGIAPLNVTPLRRSMARIPAPDGHDLRDWPMLFGPGETWYAKPDAGALIVSPAEEAPVQPHDAYADEMTLAEGLDRYSQHVTTPVTRLLASWAGLRTFAPDRQLVLGRDTANPQFIWCAAQGGYGFQTAPAAAKLVADTVAVRPSDLTQADIAALSPARFH